MKTDIIENLPGEEWRDIEGYENLYQISNKGRVKSLGRYDLRGNLRKEKFLKIFKSRDYYQVRLRKFNKNKTYYVHRLVAINFISNPNNLPQVNHKDECKTNNCVDNLEWCTPYYNFHYSEELQIKAIEKRIKKRNNDK